MRSPSNDLAKPNGFGNLRGGGETATVFLKMLIWCREGAGKDEGEGEVSTRTSPRQMQNKSRNIVLASPPTPSLPEEHQPTDQTINPIKQLTHHRSFEKSLLA